MKKTYFTLLALCAGIVLISATRSSLRSPYGMTKGTPDIRSISALSFGNDGILFIGDSKGATVYAVETKDNRKKENASAILVHNIDQRIAAALGTAKENITITDMAVNPISHKLYVAVQMSDGTPALLKVDNDRIEAVALKDVNFSSVALNDVYAEDAKDARGRSLRVSTISDIGFDNGKVLVSGLSNKEFSSSFRVIPFPFTGNQDRTSLEIYHTSHGRYETAAPVRTFTTGWINGKEYLIASYTCTPLVLFPMDDLKPGTEVRGRTVAEMGSGNTPIDMTTIKKGDETFLVMANTARPMARIGYKSISGYDGNLSEHVNGTAGASFNQLQTGAGVMQMDKLDNSQLVVIQKQANGDIDLLTINNDSLQ